MTLVLLMTLFVLFTPRQVLATGNDNKVVIIAGCQGCHRIEKRGSSLARPLLKLYKKFDKEKFLHQLKEPPMGMPNYRHLSDEMLESIFTYFITPTQKTKKK